MLLLLSDEDLLVLTPIFVLFSVFVVPVSVESVVVLF